MSLIPQVLNTTTRIELNLTRQITTYVATAWCKSGTRIPGPGTPLKFKSGTPGPPSKFKSGTPGPLSKFKSGTFIIIFLHCLTYFVLDKYIDNMVIIFYQQSVFYAIFFVLNSSTIFVKSLISHLLCLIWWRMERSMELVQRSTCPTIHEIKQFHLSNVPLV